MSFADRAASTSGGPTTGTTPDQVRTIVRQLVADQALEGDTSRWSSTKITLPNTDGIAEGSVNQYFTNARTLGIAMDRLGYFTVAGSGSPDLTPTGNATPITADMVNKVVDWRGNALSADHTLNFADNIGEAGDIMIVINEDADNVLTINGQLRFGKVGGYPLHHADAIMLYKTSDSVGWRPVSLWNVDIGMYSLADPTAANDGQIMEWDNDNDRFILVDKPGEAYRHPHITNFSMSNVSGGNADISYEVLNASNIFGSSNTGQGNDNLGLEVDVNGNGTYSDVLLSTPISKNATSASITLSSGNFAPPAGSNYDYRLFAYDTQSPRVRISSAPFRISTPATPQMHERAYWGSANAVPTTAAAVQALTNNADVQETDYSFAVSQVVNANDWFFLFVPQNRLPTSIFNTATRVEAINFLTHQVGAVTIGSQVYDAYVFNNLGLNAQYDYRVSRS